MQVGLCRLTKVKGRVKSFSRRTRKLITASLGHCTGWDTMNLVPLVSLQSRSLKLLIADTLPNVSVLLTCANQPGKAGMLRTVSVAYLNQCRISQDNSFFVSIWFKKSWVAHQVHIIPLVTHGYFIYPRGCPVRSHAR